MGVVRITACSEEAISALKSHDILKNAPTYILRKTSVAIVSRNEALLLTNLDEVYIIGDNKSNQLCWDQPYVYGPAPVLNPALSNLRIKDVIPINGRAEKFTEESQVIKSFVALAEDGRMLVWGHNASKLRGFKPLQSRKHSPMVESSEKVKWVKVVGRNGLMIGLTGCGKAFAFGEAVRFGNLTPGMGLVKAPTEHEEDILDIGISSKFIFFTTSFCQGKFWLKIGEIPKNANLAPLIYGQDNANAGTGTFAGNQILKVYMPSAAASDEILLYTHKGFGKAFTLRIVTVGETMEIKNPVKCTSAKQEIQSVEPWVIQVVVKQLKYYSSCAIGFEKFVAFQPEETPASSAVKFLLESVEDKDVTLSVGPEQEIIKAHKVILKRCDYFKTFLAKTWDNTADSNGHIQLPQFTFKRCNSFVQFLYTDKLPDFNPEDVEEYLHLADYFQCSAFRLALEASIPSKINAENVISLYQSADLYRSQVLQDECLAFAVKNGTSILVQADLKRIVTPSFLPLVACMQDSLMSFVTKVLSDNKK